MSRLPQPRSQAELIAPGIPNRRESERFAPAGDLAWIGWWEGRIFRTSPAAIVDISQGGVKVIAEMAPPRRATSWICLDGPRRTEWVEAEVLEVVRASDGSAQVRMVFRELCPYAFFEVAIYGFPENTGARALMAAGWTSNR